MRPLLASLLSPLLLLAAAPPAPAQAYAANPKLVILLVIDQFRGDYLDRFRADLKNPNGFNLFLRQGAYFPTCYYDYANTKTAPGHATIGTGAYTDGHGIGSNEWWDLSRNTDRVISSVEDERYALVGTFDDLPVPPTPAIPPAAPRIGSSPRNERASTLGDEVRLATEGQARLFGVSLKDRAAILPSGQTANASFWIDQTTGRFVTSTYYMPQLPAWATAFNKGPRPLQAIKDAGLEDTTQFYSLVGRTPAANRYELDFAQTLIDAEQLGKHPVTDVLTLSLSANDILGHQLGPDSDAEREMVLALDRDLDRFFTALDKTVGLANIVVAFTADHGIPPIPREAAKLGVNAASLDVEALVASLETSLNKHFATTAKHYLLPTQELPYLELDPRTFPTGVTEQAAEQALIDALPDAMRSLQPAAAPPNNNATPEATRHYAPARLPPTPHLAFVRSRVDIAAGLLPQTDLGRRVAHSYTPNGDWYVMVIPDAFQIELLSGIQTTHFSPWSYDRHVPLGFFGTPFAPGTYRDQVAPVDIAPTLAAILGVNAPSASTGRILTQALRPTP
jgi:predicted AlkP superfamily pyrophosphatase or phosphodiesterase